MVRTREMLARVDVIKRELCAEIAYDVDFYGWSQSVLAKKVGLSQSDCSDILRTRRLERFSVDRLIMVLIALGHSPKVMFT